MQAAGERRMAPIEPDVARTALDLLVARTATILDSVGDRFPLFAQAVAPGTWETTEDGNWCAGYWIAMLFLAARHSGDAKRCDRFKQAAYDRIPAMLSQPTDNLFAGLNHYYAGYVGFDLTGDEKLKKTGLRGACAMRELFNEKSLQIPIGHYATAPNFTQKFQATMPLDRRYLAAVDAIHTSVPVLFRAFEETGDPRFRDVAISHVERHLSWHVRPDGSTIQMTAFNPETGVPTGRHNPLAADADGCWSRGFGWHIAGLAASLEFTGNPDLRTALTRAANYYLAHVDGKLVPVWDFTVRDEEAPYDTSAAAVSAYGLLGISGTKNGHLTRKIHEEAVRVA